MLTEKELFELEISTSIVFEAMDFSEMKFIENDNVLIKNRKFKELLEFHYPGSFTLKKEDEIIVSIYIFRILQNRYFKNNKTVKKYSDSLKKECELGTLRTDYNFLTVSCVALKKRVNPELVELLNQKGFVLRLDENFESDIENIKMRANEMFVEYNAKNM